MDAKLTNWINEEAYFFHVTNDNHGYAVHMFFNENKELIKTEILKCCECGNLCNEGEEALLYNQIIEYINQNWNELVVETIHPTQTNTNSIETYTDSI